MACQAGGSFLSRSSASAGAGALTAALLMVVGADAMAASTLESAGNVLEILLPATGLGATYLYGDREGRWQWLYSGATTLGTVEVLKVLTEKSRPSGVDTASFPSGHTASAFWGAAFLNTRYGPWWGVPAYGLAALTGYSRYRTSAHYTDDVLAGAGIAMLSNWYWVRPLDDRVSLQPMAVPNGAGLKLSIADAADPAQRERMDKPKPDPTLHFELQLAVADPTQNWVQAPSPGGDRINLASYENVKDNVATAIVKVGWDLAPRQSLQFVIAPFEARDSGTNAAPLTFAGTTYPAGASISSSYLYYDFRGIYRYELAPGTPAIVRIGAGVSTQLTRVQLSATGLPTTTRVEKWDVLPVLYGELGWRFGRHWEVVGEATGIWLSGEKLADFSGALRYRFNDYWTASAGYRYYARQTNSSTLYNNVAYDVPFISLSHNW